MEIKINHTQIKQIYQHGEDTFPEECCGVLTGLYENNIPVVIGIKRMRNTNAGSRNTRYNIDPLDFVKLERELDESELEMIGIYHSHPNYPSKPSKFDLDHAWPNISYVVLSVQDGKAELLTSWRLDKTDSFIEEKIQGG